jgi:hypothetical protein
MREKLLNRSRFSSPWVGRRPMIPPVEMTKGRGALPARVAVEQDPLFVTRVMTCLSRNQNGFLPTLRRASPVSYQVQGGGTGRS